MQIEKLLDKIKHPVTIDWGGAYRGFWSASKALFLGPCGDYMGVCFITIF